MRGRVCSCGVIGCVVAALTSCSGGGGGGAVDSTRLAKPSSAAITETTSASSTAVASTAAETTVPPTFPAPELDAALAGQVDAVDGYITEEVDEGMVPWPFLELSDRAVAHPLAVSAGGEAIGTLVVVDRVDFASHVERLFDGHVSLVADVTVHGRELLTLINDARATWLDISGVPTVVARVAEVDDGQWVWEHDGNMFVAIGTSAMADYVTGLIGVQQADQPRDPYDYGALGGSVADRRVFVPGYEYVDLPVSEAIAMMAMTAVGDCAENLHAGYVVFAGDPDMSLMGAEDLRLALSKVGDVCVEGGFFDQMRSGLAAQGMTEATVGALSVWQDATRLVHVDGNTVVQISANDPASLTAMRPFIDRFLAGVEPDEVLDLAPLPIPTCLYRIPPAPGGDWNAQPAYATDCATPHQGELYHHGLIAGDAGAPYPGDTAVDADANAQCLDAFMPFVGVDYKSSRLDYLYYYPSSDTWRTGDRHVGCVLFAGEGELFRTSLAGTDQ